MSVRVSRNIIRFFTCLLILLSFVTSSFAFQEETITSNKNVYTRVVAGAAQGNDFVILDNLTELAKFKLKDTVLLIQMKGVQARVVESGFYGEVQDTTGAPGRYEFLIVEDTIRAQLKVVFTNPIINSYEVRSDVQLIRVPSYYSVRVGAELVCPPWDSISKTGGVLAMIVGRKLTLTANINVSGRGFLGGAVVTGAPGTCTQTDPANLRKFVYDNTFMNSGLKGEGLVSKAWIDFTTQLPVFPGYAKGKGPNFNGGGGGNGRFSGGAGGSHIGIGGKGGKEFYDLCSETDANLGGKTVIGTLIEGGLFLGGGGGGSTAGTGTGIKGGRGGGIIIILANELDGNGFSISANGESPAGTATGNAGAGGGGAGGSVALYLESFTTSNITLSANGGQGGRSNGYLTDGGGEGGGGGGGLIWTNIAQPANTFVIGGAKGLNNGTVTSSAGNPGLKTTSVTYVPKLNGFLFNSIRSSKTNDLIDSVCSNNVPYPVLGTTPLGGSGSYTFKWQKKNDSGGAPAIIASSGLLKDYSFSAPEADTFFIRRIVVDDFTTLTDTSKWLKIIVQPKILNNTVNIYSHIVSLTDTICWNGDPKLIDQIIPDLVIPSSRQPKYSWQDSSLIATWGAVLGTGKSYDPSAGLQQLGNRYYRRKVTYGRCADSSAIVRFHVLDTIKKNLITTRFDTICHGGAFLNLNADPGLSGGDNTFRYLWQYSQTGAAGSWNTATGVSTGAAYDPDEASAMYPGKVYYRRKVFSGAHNVCVDSSKSAIRVDWPVITANNIAADETICSGFQPVAVTGAEPLNGAGPGTFRYTYEDSSKVQSWTPIPGYIKVTGLGYAPPILTDTTKYRRIAYSSKCTDISKSVVKRVHKPITNFNVVLFSGIWDTTLCSGADPETLNGQKPDLTSGSGNPANNIYQWSSSSTKVGGYADISGATTEDYDPATLTNASPTVPASFYYRRKVTNGACSMTSDSAVKITVLPKISNNLITADPATCYNIAPNPLAGPVLTGGDGTPKWQWQQSSDGGTTWAAASGTSNTQNYAAPALTVPTQYRRLVYSGTLDCCKDTSAAKNILINPLPTGTITNAVDTICEGSPGKVFNLQITGSTASPWNIVYKENSTNKPSSAVNTAASTISINPAIPGASTDSLSFTYRLVSIRDANNCDAVATGLTGARRLVVWKVPVAGAGPDAASCGPVYKITGTKNVGTGNWTYPGVPVQNSSVAGNDLTITVDLPYVPSWYHKYRFYYNVKNWTCYSKDSTDITFYLKPDSAKAGNDTTIYSLDKEVVLPYSTPTVGTGAWTMISGGASQKNETTFTNLVIGDNVFEWRITNTIAACFSADQVKYTIENLVIPDAFSPNSDGINDEFEIMGLDPDNSNITLTILNSAGAEIYRTTNVGDTFIPWNGENGNGPMPDGTYYYLLIIESTKSGNNSVLKKSGFLILKRDKIQ